MEYICGFHNVHAYIQHAKDQIKMVYISCARLDQRAQLITTLVINLGINYTVCEKHVLDNLVQGTHQGFAAIIEPAARVLNIEQFVQTIEQCAQVVILDGITDSYNLGAIFRTCEFFGIDAIMLPKNNSANPYNSASFKAASGAMCIINIITVNNLVNAINLLKQAGFWIIGSALVTEAICLHELDLRGVHRKALVLGSEDRGISRLVLKQCDYIVTIPSHGCVVQSLNVGVAAGILMNYINDR